MPELPDEVYFVGRIPPTTENIPYYGRNLNRLYKNLNAAKMFIRAHPTSRLRVYKAKVDWEEVDVPDEPPLH